MNKQDIVIRGNYSALVGAVEFAQKKMVSTFCKVLTIMFFGSPWRTKFQLFSWIRPVSCLNSEGFLLLPFRALINDVDSFDSNCPASGSTILKNQHATAP